MHIPSDRSSGYQSPHVSPALPRVYALRQQQLREGVDLRQLTPVQMGLKIPDSFHHICCNHTLKHGKPSFRVRVCRGCSQTNHQIEVGTYSDQESAIIMNDCHEILAGRTNRLHCLLPFDVPYFGSLAIHRFQHGGVFAVPVLDMMAKLSSQSKKTKRRRLEDEVAPSSPHSSSDGSMSPEPTKFSIDQRATVREALTSSAAALNSACASCMESNTFSHPEVTDLLQQLQDKTAQLLYYASNISPSGSAPQPKTTAPQAQPAALQTQTTAAQTQSAQNVTMTTTNDSTVSVAIHRVPSSGPVAVHSKNSTKRSMSTSLDALKVENNQDVVVRFESNDSLDLEFLLDMAPDTSAEAQALSTQAYANIFSSTAIFSGAHQPSFSSSPNVAGIMPTQASGHGQQQSMRETVAAKPSAFSAAIGRSSWYPSSATSNLPTSHSLVYTNTPNPSSSRPYTTTTPFSSIHSGSSSSVVNLTVPVTSQTPSSQTSRGINAPSWPNFM